jgi:hypothetical protein
MPRQLVHLIYWQWVMEVPATALPFLLEDIRWLSGARDVVASRKAIITKYFSVCEIIIKLIIFESVTCLI